MFPTTPAMEARIFTLPELLALQPVTADSSRSDCVGDPGWGAIFGGQLLAQAIAAARPTAGDGWLLVSLHALFLRPGDPKQPVIYQVQALRQGRSFQTLRVRASQKRGDCAEVTLTYQVPEAGSSYQPELPADFTQLPAPEALAPYPAQVAGTALDMAFPAWYRARRGLDMRFVDAPHFGKVPRIGQNIRYWLRLDDAVVDPGFALHEAALAYASDECLADGLLVPFGKMLGDTPLQVLSLDHVMWFHRPLDLREWHFVDQRPLVAAGARGTGMAQVWDRDGRLVATYAQEVLLRI